MNGTWKRPLALALAVAVLGVGTGAAIAATGSSGSTAAAAAAQAPREGGPLAAAASYLGLTVDQLRTQLESGKSLAQVAQAQGKSVSGLKAALIADAKSHLAEAVADGRLTQA